MTCIWQKFKIYFIQPYSDTYSLYKLYFLEDFTRVSYKFDGNFGVVSLVSSFNLSE